MEFTVNKSEFAEAFSKASAIAPSRSPKPILQNVYAKAGSAITLQANNMESGVIVTTIGEVTKPGDTMLPASIVSRILKECTGESITISADDRKAEIVCGGSKFSCQTEDHLEFPKVNIVDPKSLFMCDSSLLREAISRTVFATDPMSSRFALSGILLSSTSDGFLDVIGTDGRRLSRASYSVDGLLGGEAILPTSGARELLKLISEGECKMWIDGHSVYYSDESIQFCCRQVEGRFPNWSAVFPDLAEYQECSVTSGSLSSGIRQAAITTDKETRAVDLQLLDGEISITGSASEVGSSAIRIPAECEQSETVRIDNRYAVDFLSNVQPSEPVKVLLSSGRTPILFRSGENYQYIVMPMATS